MKVITFEDIKNLNISPSVCYEWVTEMLEDKESAILPPKIHMEPADGVFCNVMPCVLGNNNAGVKIVTRYPKREPSLDSQLVLMNAYNGELLALMDANWITAMRTGAVAAHTVLLFAKKEFSVVGMMGLGNTARATLLILAEKEKERNIIVKLLKYKGQEIIFAERFRDFDHLHFEYVENADDLVRGSDVVISAVTYLAEDVCTGDCFDEGILVVPIHTRGFMNCDLFFDKVFADDKGHVCNFRYFNRFKKFAEVADVVAGRSPGRENDKERILAYNIGLSIHDINYAGHIYDLIKDQKGLTEINMRSPTEKFWV